MTYALECEALNKRYGTRSALTNLTVHFEQGRIIGLLGPNGSGKTTLLKLAAGLLVPSGGSIRVVGHEPGVETKGMVAYLPDRMALPAYMRTADVMDFYQDFYKDFRREAAEDELSEVRQILAEEMQGAAELSVPLEIDMKQGMNWYEAH